jgi:hypothetical protein
MAKPTQKSLKLAQLIRQAEAARFQLGMAHMELRRKLDIPLRIRDSLKSSPLKWLGGSLGVGFLGSLIFRSKRRRPIQENEKKHRGWFAGLLLMLFTLVKPTLKIYATKFLKDYLQDQLRGRSSDRFKNHEPKPY